ncbi:type II toxin-antitoxin system ParD family antitoxin [uncultured Rhodospira sp.]|uniref:ribbon-helix-helix domain-containing protein n=1 Tax=uncultured Rhodospira sp. TaxID=1936189 RepID=UPI0026270F0F|nr:type II toxin-antitoxin system ParD family antitoxin [uncultured Rhodospira sp.]
MDHVTVSLPEPLKTWCETQASAGGYADVGATVRDLIQRDHARAGLQRAIDEGLASGVSDKSLDEIMAEARALNAA